MKIIFKLTTLIIILLYTNLFGQISIKLKDKKILGDSEVVIGNIRGICEDNNLNLYILDTKFYKIHKFSSKLKYIKSFGRKGEGPGDLIYGNSIFIYDGYLILCEKYGNISYFTLGGKFIKKVNLSKIFGVNLGKVFFAGEGTFYGELKNADNIQQAIFSLKDKKILNTYFSYKYSMTSTKINKKRVAFGIYSDIYSSGLLFSHYKNRSIFAYNKKYHLIMTQGNKVFLTIKREIPPDHISRKERVKLESGIDNFNWPDNVKKILKDQIPEVKNFFYKILLSDKYIFLFRLRKNLLDKSTLPPTEVYNFTGKFIGKIFLKEDPPLLISDKYMYFENYEDMSLQRFKYKIKCLY